jgi:hypothetical protein
MATGKDKSASIEGDGVTKGTSPVQKEVTFTGRVASLAAPGFAGGVTRSGCGGFRLVAGRRGYVAGGFR